MSRAAPTASAGLSLRVVRDFDDPALAGWDELVLASVAPSVFRSREWLQAWWAAFGAGRDLFILVFQDAGHLGGIVPLYAERHRFAWRTTTTLRLVGDGSFDADHLDLIVRAGRERDVAQRFAAWLEENAAAWDMLRLAPVDAASPAAAALVEARPWSLRRAQIPALVVPLPASWDEYLARLSPQGRAGLRRVERRLEERFAVRYRRVERPEELAPALERLFDLHSRRWATRGLAGAFADPARREFYRRLSAALLARDRLFFTALELEGSVAAIEFGYFLAGTYSQVQGGFDPAFGEYSVARVLRCRILRDLIARGAQQYDFLAGDEGFKRAWSAGEYAMLDLVLARPRTWGALALRAAQLADVLRSTLPNALRRPLRALYRRVKPRPVAAEE